jgi:putative resolvase
MLAVWARSVGVRPQTAYAWAREDRMPVPFRRLPSGTILVDVAELAGDQRVVRYARVWSHRQEAELGRQTARLTERATAAEFLIDQVVAGVGSGLGGKRPKLARILSDPSATLVVVEHRERLARFGVEQCHAALAAHWRRIMVVEGETADDLVRNMIMVLTSMCAGRYGGRGARNRVLPAVRVSQHPESVGVAG